MNLAELGEAFKRARILANKTQQEVAEYSGVPRARISRFETGGLPEMGAVKLLSLFEAVGLELLARPAGHRRTLDDVLAETEEVDSTSEEARRRVRHFHRRPQPAADLDASQSGDKAPEKAQDEGSK
ncbi:XRE family transcriptional regulator [Cupriavidus sp. SK-3]|uniref:helix-turn-helix domain-containing protein n=1 Tax=Cupriavidus sp. SK-3 TaxID=1470558 RepID=UPI000448FBC8|nr:helix-turn-helix transcriptional regulator [Cupriavidus sp. SK-3]KDP88911.1 XRE family transcriptional regulator [Cupriavidus sp. SK-3]